MVVISAGWCKGTKIKAPPSDISRPTSARVREAVFSMLADAIDGAKFADLFAGSGLMGLEALSRGACLAHFYEIHPKALSILRENVALTRERLTKQLLSPRTEVKKGDFRRSPPSDQQFDIVWADPPYRLWPEVIEDLEKWSFTGLCPGGLLVAEVASNQSTDLLKFFDNKERWSQERTRRYGTTDIIILQKVS